MGGLSSIISMENRCPVWGFSCVWLAPPHTFWDIALCWALNAFFNTCQFIMRRLSLDDMWRQLLASALYNLRPGSAFKMH
jgi:hypothetical protein